MKREELVDKIRIIISTYKVYTTIEVDGNTIIYLYWNKFKNYIQVEGFDTENIYLRKYIKNTEVKNFSIMKLEKAPYKILFKLYKILSEKFKI
jgi:hypothetical protein